MGALLGNKLLEPAGSTQSFLSMTLPPRDPRHCSPDKLLPTTALGSLRLCGQLKNVDTNNVFLFLTSGSLIILLIKTCFLGCLGCAHLAQSSLLLLGEKKRQNNLLLPQHKRSYVEMLTRCHFHAQYLRVPLCIDKIPPGTEPCLKDILPSASCV